MQFVFITANDFQASSISHEMSGEVIFVNVCYAYSVEIVGRLIQQSYRESLFPILGVAFLLYTRFVLWAHDKKLQSSQNAMQLLLTGVF
jgi:hypothetical protein